MAADNDSLPERPMLHDIAIASIAIAIVLLPQVFAAWYDRREEQRAIDAI